MPRAIRAKDGFALLEQALACWNAEKAVVDREASVNGANLRHVLLAG